MTKTLRRGIENIIVEANPNKSEAITIFEDDDVGVQVDFYGIEFDEYSEELRFSFWFNNWSAQLRRFWIAEIKVNGVQIDNWELLGELESYSDDFFEYTVSGENGGEHYIDIEMIEVQIEVDDEDDRGRGLSDISLI